MRTFSVTKNGKSLFEGSLEDCHQHLIGLVGETATVSETYEAGYRIQ